MKELITCLIHSAETFFSGRSGLPFEEWTVDFGLLSKEEAEYLGQLEKLEV